MIVLLSKMNAISILFVVYCSTWNSAIAFTPTDISSIIYRNSLRKHNMKVCRRQTFTFVCLETTSLQSVAPCSRDTRNRKSFAIKAAGAGTSSMFLDGCKASNGIQKPVSAYFPSQRINGIIPSISGKLRLMDRQKQFIPLGDSNEDTETTQQQQQHKTPRKLDRIKEWMYGTSSTSKNMIQPMQQDGLVADDNDEIIEESHSKSSSGKNTNFPGLTDESNYEQENEQGQRKPSTVSARIKPTRKRSSTMDESWFENERRQIVQSYNEILDSMLNQVADERRKIYLQEVENQSNNMKKNKSIGIFVPDNAEALIRSILQREMENEIKATKDRLAKELLESYEQERMRKFLEDSLSDSSIASVVTDEKVQQLIHESETEYQQIQQSRRVKEDFVRYEEEARIWNKKREEEAAALQNNSPSSSSVAPMTPVKNIDDLDQWVLQRFQDMIEVNENKSEDQSNDVVIENLQDSLQVLKERIQTKLANKDKNKHFDDLKEWQMYRSIATRLSESQKGAHTTNEEDEEQILKLLQSWKDYIEKEERIRRLSGLSSLGPKLPFSWQEADLEERLRTRLIHADSNKTGSFQLSQQQVKKSAKEIRQELNRMSIEAMESLIKSPTTDANRRQNLQKELDYLKATLEANDYLDIDNLSDNFDSESSSMTNTAIDTKSLFRQYDNKEFKDIQEDSILGNYYDYDFSTSPTKTMSFVKDIEDDPSAPDQFGNKRSAPFFDDINDNLEASGSNKKQTGTPPPPNTPFFRDMSTFNEAIDTNDSTITDSKLGSMEDQKLEAMYRRAGAKTTLERAAIKKQYEEFQELERKQRQQSGLSLDNEGLGNDSIEVAKQKLKYQVSDVMTGDGDFDAAKVLAAIGPRPKRSKKKLSPETMVDKEEVLDSRYRAISAVGGGRYKDDPEANAKQQQAFAEYMSRESQIRETLDSNNIDPVVAAQLEIPPVDNINAASLLDNVTYAEEVIASLGSRPKPKRARVIDERTYSDIGGALSKNLQDDDDDDDVSTKIQDDASSMMPEWLRKEQEEAAQKKRGSGTTKRKSFLGSEIDEVFDDTDYEHNMRQLAEYERRRRDGDKSKRRSLGIDISEVLGSRRNSLFQSDDYADYKYEENKYSPQGQVDWKDLSFAKRKRDMLEYIELDIRDVNALMDHKDSVYSTGVSQYLQRINKPFKDFGAIFRLEGVLIDITGLQLQAWTKVALDYKFKAPTIEDCRKASVTKAELAVKDIFFWTDNFIECKNIANAHRYALRSAFETWMHEKKLEYQQVTESDPSSHIHQANNLVLGENDGSRTTTISSNPLKLFSEVDQIEISAKAWARTAEELELEKPSRESVLASFLLSPDVAVKQVFKWSDDPLEIELVVRVYRSILQSICENIKNGEFFSSTRSSVTSRHEDMSNQPTSIDPSRFRGKKPLTQNEAMEMHHQVWLSIAETYHFSPPLPEESMAAFVINDPEIAVRDGFGWTRDPWIVSNVVRDFQENLRQMMDGHSTSKGPVESEYMRQLQQPKKTRTIPTGPSPDEIFKASREAWIATARKCGYPLPDDDQIQFALTVGPEEAIVTGFQWATTPKDVTNLLSIYKTEIAKGRARWTGVSLVRMSRNPVENDNPKSSAESGPTPDDLFRVALDSWTATAQRFGYTAPDEEQVLFALSVGPEEAIVNGFEWSKDSVQIREFLSVYRQELSKRRAKWQSRASPDTLTKSAQERSSLPSIIVITGGVEWIKSLLRNEMQCGVVSYLERDQLDVLLRYAGLDELFPPDKRVSSTNNYRTDDDQLLGMALRLERRPDHCAVFDCTPHASVAAHNVEMQSVSIIGPYPRYELMTADATSASFSDLSAMNIRRLFGERTYDQPLQETQAVAQVSTRTRTKTRFLNDDDF